MRVAVPPGGTTAGCCELALPACGTMLPADTRRTDGAAVPKTGQGPGTEAGTANAVSCPAGPAVPRRVAILEDPHRRRRKRAARPRRLSAAGRGGAWGRRTGTRAPAHFTAAVRLVKPCRLHCSELCRGAVRRGARVWPAASSGGRVRQRPRPAGTRSTVRPGHCGVLRSPSPAAPGRSAARRCASGVGRRGASSCTVPRCRRSGVRPSRRSGRRSGPGAPWGSRRGPGLRDHLWLGSGIYDDGQGAGRERVDALADSFVDTLARGAAVPSGALIRFGSEEDDSGWVLSPLG